MIHSSFRTVLIVAVGMSLIQLLNVLTSYALNTFGLITRHLDGLAGVALPPFPHSSWLHLLSNVMPFVVLAWFVSLISVQRFLAVSTTITVLGGLLVWLLARPSIHVGANGWVFGLRCYLTGSGWFERIFLAVAVALLVLWPGSLLPRCFCPPNRLETAISLFALPHAQSGNSRWQ